MAAKKTNYLVLSGPHLVVDRTVDALKVVDAFQLSGGSLKFARQLVQQKVSEGGYPNEFGKVLTVVERPPIKEDIFVFTDGRD